MTVKILVTGFEPFGPDNINPSWEIASALAREYDARPDVRVVAALLPVRWEGFGPAAESALSQHQPDAIVMLGQAGGRAAITPERIGINVCNGKDNDGVERQEMPVVPGGPAGYFSSLPLRAIVDAMRKQGVPAEISNSAGTYLCNYAAYWVPHYLASRGIDIPAGFIHVPFLPEQVAGADPPRSAPSMPLSLMITGVRAAIDVLARMMRGQG